MKKIETTSLKDVRGGCGAVLCGISVGLLATGSLWSVGLVIVTCFCSGDAG